MSLDADSIASNASAPQGRLREIEPLGRASTRLAELRRAGWPKGTRDRLAYPPCGQDEREAEQPNTQRAELLAAERQQRDESAGADERECGAEYEGAARGASDAEDAARKPP